MVFSKIFASCRSSSKYKSDKDLSVKVTDIHKIEKRNSFAISLFDYEKKIKYPICVSKKCCQKSNDLLLMGEED